MYKYKIVASFKGGNFRQVALADTKEDAKHLVAEYKMAYKKVYGKGWKVIYYNIED